MKVKQALKIPLLFLAGGLIYCAIELAYRQYTHWTMFVLGGICFLALGAINEILSWNTPLPLQALIGGTIITILEFITGCIVNLWLGWHIWDYFDTPYNLLGQICLPFFGIWCLLSIVGILLDDYLRYWFFGEEKPKYKLWW